MACIAERRWAAAYEHLSRAVAERSSARPDVLVQLATAAYLVGHEDEYLSSMERAHAAYLDAGDGAHAVRTAFWLGLILSFRGDQGPAGGWFARAERLLQAGSGDSALPGYLLIPRVHRLVEEGQLEQALSRASRAVDIAGESSDAELGAIARHLQGRVLLKMKRVREGLACLDEALVAISADDLSAITTGLIYCSAIDGFREVCALDRTRQWTDALDRWCNAQLEMSAFTGRCQAHRAENLQLQGDWQAARAEAERARERFMEIMATKLAGEACYRIAEIHRLRGELDRALDLYREAGALGFDPQPGLALVDVQQGRVDAAVAGLKGARVDAARQGELLRARVSVYLEAQRPDEAKEAWDELAELARPHHSEVLDTMLAQAQAELQLADGQLEEAARLCDTAIDGWARVCCPYEEARARALRGEIARREGDQEGAEMRWRGALAIFERMGAGAAGDLRAKLTEDSSPASRLTARELEVLTLVAAGSTNRAIAETLALSVKTIDRHVSNIFVKLGVSSRAAATALAIRHGLI
jgi:DNA-binding CsgD family transcriptional regulator/predicted negative regulator of RcsB-dependent stress response